MKIRYFVLLIILVSACSYDDTSPSDDEQSPSDNTQSSESELTVPEHSDEVEIVAENLEEPWEIAMQEGRFYISERTGSIVTVANDWQTRKPVQLEKDLSNQSEAGLLGLAFPDDFATTNEAIAYYSYQENNTYYQRVVKIEELDNQWQETSVLLDEIPGGQVHHGGRLEIGPDSKLYITTGDATNPELSQDMDSLAGKILRMKQDGAIPDDNPFENSYIYSYGHRNSQGLAWNDEHELYATEHGSNAHDEINRITKGRNYGWPVIQGDETAEDMNPPVIHSGENTWAPSGMTYHDGYFYFASLAGEALRRFDPNREAEEVVISEEGRVRDAFSTEEGIYYLTNNTDGRGNPAEDDDRLLFIPNSRLE
ncbi:Glucose/arabinose dehydrogenase, beta-propeller fold [Lentibacillus halodurans]|uniref:Glucose/arabinose dehydrogenase, beta-propeller fold n=1 Tax=Lentibacillus halodurans TaxID=237679 RepID=A0A1I0XUM3_9BACI|nr:PQQ-dependent sugar dehydrogenase [Lentibacillus halodurans]SFB04701.1 Glucose/arabinose dehydrogenase, beta-propeller fold [Lentibacillus halodurans]